MKNLKRILTLLVVLAMVFACVFALAACGEDPKGENPGGTNPGGTTGGGSGSGSGEGGGSSTPAEVPTEEGKITFFCTIEGYEVPSYAAPFLLGPYATTTDAWVPGVEMTNLAGTNVWYVMLEIATLDEATYGAQWNNYMVDLGYGKASNLPAAKLGETGVYRKSDETAKPGGTNNPTFTYDGGNKVDLGVHHFSSVTIPEPVELSNVQMRANFTPNSKYFNDNTVVYIIGSFNNWNATIDGPSKATKVTTGIDSTKVVSYQMVISDVFADAYEACVVVFPNGLGNQKLKKDDGTDGDLWTYYGAIEDAIQVKYQGGNIRFELKDTDTNKTNNFFGESFAGYEQGIDLSKAVEKVYELAKPMDYTFKITFKTAIPEDQHVYLCGEGFGFGWNCSREMTTTDHLTFTLTIHDWAENEGNELEFKVVVGQPTQDKDGKPDWPKGVEVNSANVKIEVAEGENLLFKDAQEYTAPAAKPAE